MNYTLVQEQRIGMRETNQDYALHGTYWHNNFGNPMSHGCVNMKTNEASWVFEYSNVGTWVIIHY